jgi:hypothetical protein
MTLTLMISGHRIGHYSAEGKLLTPLSKKRALVLENDFYEYRTTQIRGGVEVVMRSKRSHNTTFSGL